MKLNKKNPTVSIIIPVYNRKKLFFRAYDSVMNQSYDDYELIIVDDGSSDSFHKKLFDIMKHNYRVKFIRHSNRGTALTLNTGISAASGKYITFLDSDDEYSKEHIAKRARYMNKNKNVDIIHSPAIMIGKEEDMYVPDVRNRKRLIHLNDCVLGATIFGKKEAFYKLDGFRNVFSYDSDFINRAEKLLNVTRVDYMTYFYYRDTSDSVLTKFKKEMNAK
ncbi:MAG: glycosyltransferase family A protein [Candidatus Kapaibacterium sp.]